jgi:hypothetical protein
MSNQEVRYYDSRQFAGVSNPEIRKGLDVLGVLDKERAKVAHLAAREIIVQGQGETVDIGLYYLAMFGKDPSRAGEEDDEKFILPATIIRDLLKPQRLGQPVVIRDLHYPEHNVTVGIISSFSEYEYQPFKFTVKYNEYTEAEDPGANGSLGWLGSLSVAIKEIVPIENNSYEIGDTIAKNLWVTRTGVDLNQYSPSTGELHISRNFSEIANPPSSEGMTEIYNAGLKVFQNLEKETFENWRLRWLADKMQISSHLSSDQIWSVNY